jgi:hypothetical protein
MSVDYKLLAEQMDEVGILISEFEDDTDFVQTPANIAYSIRTVKILRGLTRMLDYMIKNEDGSNITPVNDENSREKGAEVINDPLDFDDKGFIIDSIIK